jgi:hypothetical protein
MHCARRPVEIRLFMQEVTILKRAIPLVLSFAAMCFVAGRTEDEKASFKRKDNDPYVVLDERAALALVAAQPQGFRAPQSGAERPVPAPSGGPDAGPEPELPAKPDDPIGPPLAGPEPQPLPLNGTLNPAKSQDHANPEVDPFGPPPAGPRGSNEPVIVPATPRTDTSPSPWRPAPTRQPDEGVKPKNPFGDPPGPEAPPPKNEGILAKLKRLQCVDIARDGTIDVLYRRRCPLTEDDLVALAALPNLRSLVLGGGVISERAAEALAKSPKLVSLSMHGTNVGDQDVRMIATLPRLRSLDVSNSSVTSVGLAYLKGHPALRELKLGVTRVGNLGMEAISRNENLASLDVSGTRVDGDGMVYIGKLRHLRSLRVGPNVSNDALAAIEGLVELEVLWGTLNVDDAGLSHLRSMTKLRRLDVVLRLVTDDGLRSIRGLKHLERLDLQLSKITDRGMEYVGEMGGLHELRLNLTKITDAGMTPVANLKHLQVLECRHTQIGDAALVPIGTLPELYRLNLDGTRVTSTGMRSLTGLSSLHMLDLTGTRVDDEGMTYVAKLPHLRTLYVSQTTVGDAGLEKLAGMTGPNAYVTANQTRVTERGASFLRQRNIDVSYEYKPAP